MMRVIQLRLLRAFGLGFASRRHRLGFTILAVFIVLLILHNITYRRYDPDFIIDDELSRTLRDPTIRADKWIVVTTTRSPTDAVRILAEQPGWKVVVVGDKKTPKTWKWPNVIYLDLKAQISLGYSVLRYLSFNSYARKIAGYLYAIEHGAKYIYDTDDDNFLEHSLNGFEASRDLVDHLVVATNNLTNNPYVHFGQSTMWPRGFPLERIGFPTERRYSICETAPPLIQQGLVNGDPDVDAIFRLTRRHKTAPLKLAFDQSAPPYALPPRTFAPFNSQNTFFAANAFWGLLLPVASVPDRASDIYRSYWAQRLLWLVGGGVSFAPPNTLQIRNPHSDLADANEESILYREVGRYIEALNRWDCGEDAQFIFDCVSKLSRYLVSEGFWTELDADMVDAWLSDLSSIGYNPPPLSTTHSRIETCLAEKSRSRRKVVFYPVEQNTTMPSTANAHIPPEATSRDLVLKHVTSACGAEFSEHWKLGITKARKYPDILLVISIPGNIHSSLPSLEAIYHPHFPNILYCAQHKISDEFIDRWKISVVFVNEDPSLLPCILAAGAIRYGVHGILHVPANVFLNSERSRITTFMDSLVWITGDFQAYSPSTLKWCYRKSIECRHMDRNILGRFSGMVSDTERLSGQQKAKLRACILKLERDPTWVSQKDMLWIADTVMYVPTRLVQRLGKLREVLSPDRDRQHDMLVPLMFECEQLTVNYLHHSTELETLVNSTSQVDYVLPFSFDKVASAVDTTKQFCAYIEQFK